MVVLVRLDFLVPLQLTTPSLRATPPIHFVAGGEITPMELTKFQNENENEYSFKYIIDNPHIIKKYIVMKCINEYEYWNNDTQIPELKSNYKLIEFNKLEDIKFI